MEARNGSMQWETFTLKSVELEDLRKATDSALLEEAWQAAGMTALVKNAEPLRRAQAAAQDYVEMPAEDYALYREALPVTVKIDKLTVPPPEDVVALLIGVKSSRAFSHVAVLADLGASESLLMGYVKIGEDTRYFKIAHWGYHLTSIEELRRRRRFGKAVGRGFWRVIRWRPRLGRSRPAPYVLTTAIAAGACWLLEPISWWLFSSVMILAMSFCGYLAMRLQSRSTEFQRWMVGALIAGEAVGVAISGGFHIHKWETADRTEKVMVCGKHNQKVGDEWVIETTHGTRNLEAGFYNGAYYPKPGKVLAQSLVGNWVQLTIHGHSSGGTDDGPYVTKVQTLGPGRCG